MPAAPRASQAEVADTVALWFGRFLAVLFVAVVVSMMLTGAGRSHLLFPYSWEAEDRKVLETSQLTSVYNRIDSGVRTYHLLYGMYPEELRLLVDLELIQARDRFGPRRPVSFRWPRMALTIWCARNPYVRSPTCSSLWMGSNTTSS